MEQALHSLRIDHHDADSRGPVPVAPDFHH
jgi:hypothetical protein